MKKTIKELGKFLFIGIATFTLTVGIITSSGCKKEENTNGTTTTTTTTIPPTLTTDSVINIGAGSAQCGGVVLNDGGTNVTARGVCWDTVPNPTIANHHTNDAAGTGAFVSNITGLIPNKLYYVRAYATNSLSPSYGLQRYFTTLPVNIGVIYQGGIIGYIYQAGDLGYVAGQTHGIIVSPTDLPSAPWGCSGTSIVGTSTAIGSGLANTNAIITGCTTTGIAALLCINLNLNGYSDWYLPSLNELINIKNNGVAINNTAISIGGSAFFADNYFSSTEYDNNFAYILPFINNAGPNNGGKSSSYRIRAVRSF